MKTNILLLKQSVKSGKKMEEIDIRFTLRTPEEVEKFKVVKIFLKISANTKVLAFLISDKFQEIQKLAKGNISAINQKATEEI